MHKLVEVREQIGILWAVCRVTFFGWQALMIYWFTTLSNGVPPPNADPAMAAPVYVLIEAYAIFIISIWIVGSVILGLLVLLTRRKKIQNGASE